MSKAGHALTVTWCVLVGVAMIPVSLAAAAVGLLMAVLWFFFAIVLPGIADPLKLPGNPVSKAIADADANIQRVCEWYGCDVEEALRRLAQEALARGHDWDRNYQLICWPDAPGEPTSATINGLPKHMKDYLMWLHTDADPASTLQDNWHLTQENKALRILLEEKVNASQ